MLRKTDKRINPCFRYSIFGVPTPHIYDKLSKSTFHEEFVILNSVTIFISFMINTLEG